MTLIVWFTGLSGDAMVVCTYSGKQYVEAHTRDDANSSRKGVAGYLVYREKIER